MVESWCLSHYSWASQLQKLGMGDKKDSRNVDGEGDKSLFGPIIEMW
jgi:hypothetical protein